MSKIFFSRTRVVACGLIYFLATAVFDSKPCQAQDAYGAKGLFPVYETGGQWLIFDKQQSDPHQRKLLPGARFLVIGQAGAGVFDVARSSPTYGGMCRDRKPLRLRAALLKGPRSAVGHPVLAIHVPANFNLKSSKAVYRVLKNEVDEGTYQLLISTLTEAALAEAKSGAFRFKLDDAGATAFMADPRPEKIALKIDFAARTKISGLSDPIVLITGAQISSTFRRCLRITDGNRLIGECVELPHALLSETAMLRFVLYDPAGAGSPFLLAYTTGDPLWGHERWGFVLRPSGARMFLRDALDPRCRDGF